MKEPSLLRGRLALYIRDFPEETGCLRERRMYPPEKMASADILRSIEKWTSHTDNNCPCHKI